MAAHSRNFLPGEPHRQWSLEGTVHGVTKSQTQLSDQTIATRISIPSMYGILQETVSFFQILILRTNACTKYIKVILTKFLRIRMGSMQHTTFAVFARMPRRERQLFIRMAVKSFKEKVELYIGLGQ